MTTPARGDVWLADLNPTRGHEQAGRRPVLIVSSSLFNSGPADLVVALPLTTRHGPIPTRVRVLPPDGGLRSESAVICDAIRSISHDRLVERWGAVGSQTLHEVEDALRILLEL